MSPEIFFWIGLIALGAAFTQAISGFGFSLFAIPLFALVIGPMDAVVLATLLSGFLSVGAALFYRRDVHWRAFRRISVSAIAGIPIGLLIAQLLSERLLTVVIAVCVVFAAVFFGLVRQRATDANPHMITAGVLSGALLTATGMNGPPLVLSFHRMRMDGRTFRASLQGAFAFQDILAIAGFAAVGRIGVGIAWYPPLTLPLLVVGWWLGALVFNRLPTRYYARITVWLLVATGCYTAINEIV